MKIIIVGGAGEIGKAVVAELSQRHEVVVAGRSRGDVKVDVNDCHSIEEMYKTVGKVDAVISAFGKAEFDSLDKMTPKRYQLGLQNKLMGQVNLVLLGMQHVNDKGSFTLTSGILNQHPLKGATSSAMANGAIDSFVKVAAVDMPRGIRINVVSPTILSESMEKYGELFKGFTPVPAATVAKAYSNSVEGVETGQLYKVGY